MLLFPQVACFIEVPQGIMKAANFVRLCFPLTFYVLVNLCFDEGRARERERTERTERR